MFSTPFQKLACWLFAPWLFLSCGGDFPVSTIPNVPIDVTINVTNQAFLDLQPGGLGYVFIDDQGYRGLVIYRESSSSFACFDRACSFNPQESCGQVGAQPGGFGLVCGCPEASSFSWEGLPTGGPAVLGLRQYNTRLEGNLLTIVN